jgi:hypothetical protein
MEIEPRDSAQLIRARRLSSLVLEILLPDDVLEWFISVKNAETGAELFSDCVEHYAIGGETREQLEEQLVDEVIGILTRASASLFRVQPSGGRLGRARLQFETAQGWVDAFEEE